MEKFNAYCGIDLHKHTLTVAVLGADGKEKDVVSLPTKCVGRIRGLFEDMTGPISCAIEAVGMYRWLWDLLKPLCEHLVLADATELAWRRGKRKAKTDIKDAQHLAKLLYMDDVPAAYVPEGPVHDLRRLGRQWHRNSRLLAGLKVRMRWVLNQANLRGPTNITGDSARRWFLAQGDKLDPIAFDSVSQLLSDIEHHELAQGRLRRKMRFTVREHFRALGALLETVPGIGTVLGAIIIGETGDFSRFDGAERFACYTGLTERVRESAGKRSPGHISKAGSPTLRWALTEAACTLCRVDPLCKSRYEALARRSGSRKSARAAMARKLACAIWKMTQTGEVFRRTGSTQPTAAANKAKAARRHAKTRDVA
jgi:transposase